MLRAYHGGFLGSIAGLELSLNYCSHACAYCFANAKKPGRRADLTQAMNLLADFRGRDTLEARLLAAGYPVLFSNNVDPFARTNYRQAIPLLELMAGQGVPVMMQSRGGEGWREAVKILPPGGWYVSVCHQDDRVRRKVEPGAPSLPERFAMIGELLAAGWVVDVGINPYHPDWVPDPDALLRRLYALGVRRVTVAELHVSHDLERALKPADRTRVTLPVVQSARGKPGEALEAAAHAAAERARDMGFLTWRFLATYPTDYYAAYREKYPVGMPLFTDFVAHCHRTLKPGQVFRWKLAEDFWAAYCPPGEFRGMHSYIGAAAHDAYREMGYFPRSTFAGLLARAHRYDVGKFRIAKCKAFAYLRDADGCRLTDDDGYPLLVWLGHPGREEWEVSIEEALSWADGIAA